jgi:hypothetical protein
MNLKTIKSIYRQWGWGGLVAEFRMKYKYTLLSSRWWRLQLRKNYELSDDFFQIAWLLLGITMFTVVIYWSYTQDYINFIREGIEFVENGNNFGGYGR